MKVFETLIAFIIVFLIYLIFVILNKRGRKKLKNGIEARFLEKVYKVDLKKIDDKKFALYISIINSIIISIAFTIINIFFDKIIFQILLSFPILVVLIILLYSFLGRRLK